MRYKVEKQLTISRLYLELLRWLACLERWCGRLFSWWHCCTASTWWFASSAGWSVMIRTPREVYWNVITPGEVYGNVTPREVHRNAQPLVRFVGNVPIFKMQRTSICWIAAMRRADCISHARLGYRTGTASCPTYLHNDIVYMLTINRFWA